MSKLELRDVAGAVIGPVSLSVEPGECVCLWGPSGGGKTLLLRAIADLDPHTGRVELDGNNAESFSPPEWRRHVGLLPAESGWWEETVGAHFPSDENDWLRRLGFGPEVAHWNVDRLSTGERQRLAFARLLVNEPKVLLLDEPTSALDPENGRTVEEIISTYRTETDAAVLWVSHDRDQVRRVADRNYRMADGRLCEETDR